MFCGILQFSEWPRIGLAAVLRSHEVDGVNTLHSMFPLAPEGLEWSDRGVNIHSQFSEASGRLCGGSEIVRGRGVNVHSMFPVAPEGLEWSDRGRGVNFHSQFYEAPDRLCGGSENLFVYLSLWYGRLYLFEVFLFFPVFPQPGRLPKSEEILNDSVPVRLNA